MVSVLNNSGNLIETIEFSDCVGQELNTIGIYAKIMLNLNKSKLNDLE